LYPSGYKSHFATSPVLTDVTVLLRITRTTGPAESYRLPMDGDVVHVPHPLMTSADVVGFDVELISEGEAQDQLCVAGAQSGGTGAGPRGI
jgi:hypothetical protein